MLSDKRHERILREIRLHGSVSVTDFAERAAVSAMTVRRDLAALEEKGLLHRTHGGAVAAQPATADGRPADAQGAAARIHGSTARATAALGTIGMVAPSASYYYPQIIRGAEDAARRLGARLVLGISNYSEAEERRQIQRLIANGVDGLLVTPAAAQFGGTPTFTLLANAPQPVVVVERSIDEAAAVKGMEAVRTDHVAGAEMAVQHLAALGHGLVGLAAKEGSPTSPSLHEGYERALARLGLERPFAPVVLSRPLPGEEIRTAEHDAVLDACLATGTRALVVHTDEEATVLLHRAMERGIAVPGGLSIIAYDNEVAALATVPLTSISPPKYDVGYLATVMCCERITGAAVIPGGAPRRTRLLPELISRESTAAPPDRNV